MDEDIIRNILNGDIEAYRYLITKYKNASFSLARSIVKSDLSAEEAVQDAFLRAFQHLRKFRGKAAFSTWFYRIVVNESLKKINKRKADYSSIQPDYSLSDTLSIDPEVIEKLHIEEQREFIQQTLDKLRSNESLLLKLFYLEEKKLEEIKLITGLTVANIKVTLHRARKNFASLYRQHFNDN